MIHDLKPPLDEALLEHFGVKGMHWGQKKQRTPTQQAKHARRIKVAKVAGAITAAAVVAAGAYYVSQHGGNVSLSQVKKTTPSVKTAQKFVEAQVKEPVGILHVARGHNKGYTVHHNGGLGNFQAEQEFLRGGTGDSSNHGFFNRYGKNLEKVVATFKDPEGRHDFSGRHILHDVVIPASMSHGLNSAEDVQKLIWPHIKDQYNAFYESSKERRY